MLKTIGLKDAVGTRLAHDMTEIRPGKFKGPAFRKGHTVCAEGICHLQKLGKNHLYCIDPEESKLHEDQTVILLAKALAGPGVTWEDAPKEGKISLHARYNGMFSVDAAALAAFNMVDAVMRATIHSHTLARKRERVAATRAISRAIRDHLEVGFGLFFSPEEMTLMGS